MDVLSRPVQSLLHLLKAQVIILCAHGYVFLLFAFSVVRGRSGGNSLDKLGCLFVVGSALSVEGRATTSVVGVLSLRLATIELLVGHRGLIGHPIDESLSVDARISASDKGWVTVEDICALNRALKVLGDAAHGDLLEPVSVLPVGIVI